MAQYNLTDNTAKAFTFTLGDLEFSFRYPTTQELRDISVLNTEIQTLVDEKASEEVITAKSKESEEKMNALVTPVGHENSISAVLEDQPINVIRNFRAMMAKKISLG